MTRSTGVSRHEPWFLKFHDLMRFMVREVLLVSSSYDAFIMEEDGRLEERLLAAYADLNLSSVPRITHVTTAKEALMRLRERRFDMVITVARVEDSDAANLARRIKMEQPGIPVVLLVFDEEDLKRVSCSQTSGSIDRIFLWTGDTQILVAAIKLIEDSRNVEEDTERAGVQVIIVVEDSLRRYSTFLALLYSELMRHARSLLAEGLNTTHRILRGRARPKILLAGTFEEAIAFFRRYQRNVMGLVSDVRFPFGGVEDPEAGFHLVSLVRKEEADLPILVQSAEHGVKARAEKMGVSFADKNSPNLLEQIRSFLTEALGFGDFVFRLPDRTEVGRASDIYELAERLKTVPAQSVRYHASRNHFSMWLNARGVFDLAAQVRCRSAAEFKDPEEIRSYLIEALRQEIAQEQLGVVADFSLRKVSGTPIVRVGGGSMGGKGRGIAFLNWLLARDLVRERFREIEVTVPRTVVIGSDEYDRFLEENALDHDALLGEKEDLLDVFLEGQLPEELMSSLEVVARSLTGPLAVRSSSLLEDSRYQPFAGIYATYMLPNQNGQKKRNFRQLCQAVKAVYASTFSHEALSYLRGTGHSIEEEKMAVVVQEMVGSRYGDRFYPLISGVAQSRNHYPVGPQRSEDGVAVIALGLGQAVVAGGRCLRFSPKFPGVLPQYPTARSFLHDSQSSFYALDMSLKRVDFRKGTECYLKLCELADAEADGTLSEVGSVYCTADDAIRDNLSLVGPRILTFNNILKWRAYPVADLLDHLLELFHREIAEDVEIEFALEHPGQDGAKPRRPVLSLLQVRPMATQELADERNGGLPPKLEEILCRSSRALGHGYHDVVRDIILVNRRTVDGVSSPQLAREVGLLTAPIQKSGRPFLLIGPGRWGTADPALGIPVDWSQIAGVKTIIETVPEGRAIEPSQGTHFLQNITFLGIGYVTVGRGGRGDEEFLDWDWLLAAPAEERTASVLHINLDKPLSVAFDGKRGAVTILKPGSRRNGREP